MNQAQFARHIGVSKPRITKLIADGRLDGSFTLDENGKRHINAKKAVKLLDQVTSPTSTPKRDKMTARPMPPKVKKVKPRKSRAKAKTTRKVIKKPAKTPPKKGKEETILDAGTKGMTYGTARTYNEQYKAALKKLEYDQKKGTLINATDAERDSFNLGRQVRDQCLAIADRCSPLVAAEEDPFQCKQILLKEISYILDELSNTIARN